MDLCSASQPHHRTKHIPPEQRRITHSFAEVSDAPDLKGSCRLGGIQLEVNRRPGYFRQGKALPHWSGHMKMLLLHLTVEQTSREMVSQETRTKSFIGHILVLLQFTSLRWMAG